MSPQRITELIDNDETLTGFCAQLSQSPFITIDTEFIRDRTYWPRLCLIQLANHDIARAIDPLVDGINLTPLADLLANSKVIKVFHAARQDVEIFVQQNGTVPTPLFDTQIAAMVCGFGDSVGYDRLVEKFAGARIDKGSRFTDWSRRPLSGKQIGYALDDVTHLLKVYEALYRQLEKSQRAHWLEEELGVLTDNATYDQIPEEAWRRLKLRSRNTQYLGVAKELAAWREREAQRRNMPRSHVLKDEAIQELAAEIGLYVTSQVSAHFESLELESCLRALRSTPPQELAGSPIVEIKDWLNQPSPHNTNLLEFRSQGGSRVSIRPSGTEPKVKIYLEQFVQSPQDDLASARAQCDAQLESLGLVALSWFRTES